MKKVIIEKPGNYDRLQVKEYPNPVPKKGEVLIACRASGVNFADCCVRMGVYRPAKVYVGWPITPGFEVTGVVEAVGEGVTHFKKGDRVIGVTRFGGYTSHLVIPEDQVFQLPDSLSFEQGAAFPTVFLTAYYALFELAHPHRDDKILIHSAAGGVGSALVEFGKLAGCHVTGVVGAPHKINAVLADSVIDKSTQPIWKEIELYDVIFDANGTETLKESYRHLAPGGKLVVYGFHTMLSKGRGTPNWLKVIWDYFRIPKFNPLNMTTDNHSVLAFNLAYMFDKKEILQEGMNTLLKWIREGKIKLPTITTYPIEQVSEAHKALESGQTIGKLVLTI